MPFHYIPQLLLFFHCYCMKRMLEPQAEVVSYVGKLLSTRKAKKKKKWQGRKYRGKADHTWSLKRYSELKGWPFCIILQTSAECIPHWLHLTCCPDSYGHLWEAVSSKILPRDFTFYIKNQNHLHSKRQAPYSNENTVDLTAGISDTDWDTIPSKILLHIRCSTHDEPLSYLVHWMNLILLVFFWISGTFPENVKSKHF